MNAHNAYETLQKPVMSRLEMLERQSGAAVMRNGQICKLRPPIRRRVLGGTDGS